MPSKSISAAAAILGRKGGSKKSDAKTKAARLNPIGHGRPRLPDDQLTPAGLYQRQRRERMKKEKNMSIERTKQELLSETHCQQCGRPTDYDTPCCGHCRHDAWKTHLAECRARHFAHSGENTAPPEGYANCPQCRTTAGYAAR